MSSECDWRVEREKKLNDKVCWETGNSLYPGFRQQTEPVQTYEQRMPGGPFSQGFR